MSGDCGTFPETLYTADLFCGAGGLTEGLSQALEQLIQERTGRTFDEREVLIDTMDQYVDHVAINHWQTAIDTHEANHPWARHEPMDIEAVKPWEVVPSGRLHLLGAAPPCQDHSNAKAGKPRDDQHRAHPWVVTHWITALHGHVDNILIENVPEWVNWGPLDDDNRRIDDQKGDYFRTFVQALRGLGYAVDAQVLNAADYGDPTTRKRLFLIARKEHRPVWPEPTHAAKANGLPRWRSAAECIDWSDTGQSIWTRDRPLVQTTMRRIAEGLRRYSHEKLGPFADTLEGLTPERVKLMQRTALDPEDVTQDLVAAACDPFLVKYYGTATASDVDEPLATVTGQGGKFALCCPFLIGQHGGSVARSVDEPSMTVAGGGAISLTTPAPFVLPPNGIGGGTERTNRPRDAENEPLQTITASRGGGHLVSSWLVPFFGERAGQDPRTNDLREPMPTVCGNGAGGLTSAYLVQYHGQSTARSVDEPMPTATTRDRFALVVPELHPVGLDIHFRMLKVRELARAMGFPDSYTFTGTKTERRKQVGNAIPCGTARELCYTLLTDRTPPVSPPERKQGFDPDEHRERAEARASRNGHGQNGHQDTLEVDAQ